MNAKFQWMFDPNNDKVLILMRGVPSTGKSYRALELAGDDPSVIHSADHFYGKTLEEYVANWSIEKQSSAHKQCQKNIAMRLQRQLPLAIVDNTNTQVREMMPYFEAAVQYQYRVQIEEPTSDWWVNDIAPYLDDKEKNRKHLEKMCKVLWELNQKTHKVPLESITKMLFRYHYNVTIEQLANIYARNSGWAKDDE